MGDPGKGLILPPGVGRRGPTMAAGATRRVCMVIAPDRFRDEELFETRRVLEAGGVRVTVASRTTAPAKGMLGGVAKPDIAVDAIDPAAYDALVFVGGGGAEVYFDDAKVHALARSAEQGGKLVAAICIAPSILANAGLLAGRKATVWNGAKYVGILKAKGATYLEAPVVRDGRFVTGNGPEAAREFGEALLEALGERERGRA